MALTEQQIQEIDKAIQPLLEERRPPEELRNQLDVLYRIEGQSVVIYELRPHWDNPMEKELSEIAKATYVKTQNEWKLYWMRGDLKWHSYQPNPTVKEIKKLFEVLDEDEYGCFWG